MQISKITNIIPKSRINQLVNKQVSDFRLMNNKINFGDSFEKKVKKEGWIATDTIPESLKEIRSRDIPEISKSAEQRRSEFIKLLEKVQKEADAKYRVIKGDPSYFSTDFSPYTYHAVIKHDDTDQNHPKIMISMDDSDHTEYVSKYDKQGCFIIDEENNGKVNRYEFSDGCLVGYYEDVKENASDCDAIGHMDNIRFSRGFRIQNTENQGVDYFYYINGNIHRSQNNKRLSYPDFDKGAEEMLQIRTDFPLGVNGDLWESDIEEYANKNGKIEYRPGGRFLRFEKPNPKGGADRFYTVGSTSRDHRDYACVINEKSAKKPIEHCNDAEYKIEEHYGKEKYFVWGDIA